MNADPTSATEDPLVGRIVEGRFEVRRRLAAGGMGVVYEALQIPLGRPVALKILESKTTPGVEMSFGQRFFLEASAAAKLGHPNTIVVHDYGKTDDGLYFIAMEYLDGGTLADRLSASGPLSPPQALHVGMQIASSLRDAHAQGLVHRDLKPGNVMFAPRGGDPLFVKVLDFGLVKVLGEGSDDLNLTQSGVMMGSPRYMSPEQVKAQQVDARTDIYSFGAVLHHALTGAPPFAAGSAYEAMNHHVNTPAPPLKRTWPGCPAGPALEAAVLRCLAKHPAERFQSMDELMAALRGCEAEAGAVGHGAGSYLAASHGGASMSGHDSNPSIAQSGMRPSGAGAASSRSNDGGSNKTVRFDGSEVWESARAGAVVANASAAAPAAKVEAAKVEPPKRSSAGLILGVAIVGVLGLLVAGATTAALLWPKAERPASAGSTTADPPVASPEDTPSEAPTATATSEPPVAPAPQIEPPAQPAAETPPLMLRSDPDGARVRRDGVDLGDTPLPLVIPAGERWTIEIAKDGYETRTVTVLGGQPALTLHLEPARAQRPGRPRVPVPAPQVRPLDPRPQPRPTSRPPVYAPDLNDPWAGRR